MEDNLSPKQQRGEDQQQTLKVCVLGGECVGVWGVCDKSLKNAFW